MVLIIAHRAQGVQWFDMVQQKIVKNHQDNHRLAVEYFIEDYARHHVDMIEIDVWEKGGKLWVGHDEPTWPFNYLDWWKAYGIIVHCKNIEAMAWLQKRSVPPAFDFFFHDQDDATLTRCGRLWVHPRLARPGSPIPDNSYLVMPPTHPALLDEEVIDLARRMTAICTDYPEEMDKILNGTE